jgi:para-nitrobenzyl esterase
MMSMADSAAPLKSGSPAPVLVPTALGQIRGVEHGGVQMFRGIRYGQAPVGPLRFRPPVPVAPWTDVLDATTFGPVSFQPYDASVGHHVREMSEDCLSLNIWAPTEPGPHPVLVWIHGGGQTIGSTRRAEYEGSHFARNGVVCVTVGYRLGALGFLELGELLGPAYRGSSNNALRDVLLALRWVNEHIAEFGGDPKRVTLGGESAGAKNATTLAGVPEANALFQRLVVCSGGAQTLQTLADAESVARRVLEEAGIASADARRLLDFSVEDLLLAQESAARRWPRKFAFRPVVDGSFFPAPLLDQITAGTCVLRPILIGTSRDEYEAFSAGKDPQSVPEARDLAHMPPDRFAAIEQRYDEIAPELSPIQRRIRAMTAEEYWIPSVRLAEHLAQRKAAVWMYRFDGLPGHQGRIPATHVADLPLWWGHSHPSASSVAHHMHDALSAFVRGEDLVTYQKTGPWPLYDSARRAVRVFGSEDLVISDPSGPERTLWAGML